MHLFPQLSYLHSSPHERTCTTAATLQHHCPFLSHPHLPSLLPISTTKRSRGRRERRRRTITITIFITNYQLIRGATLPYQPASAALQQEEAQQDLQAFNSIFQSFPAFTSPCKFPQSLSTGCRLNGHVQGGIRTTGTLFGHRKARINLAIQDNPRCLPFLLELHVPTNKLLHDMGSRLVRIALEWENKPGSNKVRLMEESMWTMYCYERKTGYAAKREDLNVMQLLHAVSMGAGVVRGQTDELRDREMGYMRAHFGRVIGSNDSETSYMMNPNGNSGPELTVFFVRI